MTDRPFTFEVPDAVIDAIADRVADILATRADDQDDGWLDAKAAAAYVHCPVSRIYSLNSANRIPVHRDGSRLLFRRSELDAWIEAGGGRRP